MFASLARVTSSVVVPGVMGSSFVISPGDETTRLAVFKGAESERKNDDPDDDRWAFFVRNWGNQGYCSTDQGYYRNYILQDNIIKLKIPHDDITDAEFMANISSVNDDNNKLSIEWAIVEGGILFTFHLDEPESRTAFVGDLTIKWKNPDRPPGPRNDFNKSCGSATLRVHMSSVEEKEAHQIERMDTASRKELFMKVREQFQTKMNAPPRAVTLKKGAASTKSLSKKELKKINYSKMFYPVRDTAAMVRKSKRINYIREFLKAKGIN